MKAILVMEMPDGCDGCSLCAGNGGCYDCASIGAVMAEPCKERPDWCPLRPMPERKPEAEQDEYGFGDFTIPIWRKLPENIGWNACIDAIERSEKNGKHS